MKEIGRDATGALRVFESVVCAVPPSSLLRGPFIGSRAYREGPIAGTGGVKLGRVGEDRRVETRDEACMRVIGFDS